MIVKSPYAFLIKKFKLIHFIMFCLLAYIILSCYDIFSFFNSYASSNYVASVDYSISGISIFLYLACILVIIFSLIIYYLLIKKQKPYKFYLFNIILYIIIIIYLIYIMSQLSDMHYNTFSFERVRFIRDICLIVLLPQVFSVFFVLTRALGFNIKSFDFQKDIAGLNISEEDAQEIELSLGEEAYKYKRYIRKFLRYTKYFLAENKFFVTIVGSISALIVSLFIIVNVKNTINYYNKQEVFIANSIYYTVLNSFVVDSDTHNKKINEGYYYLLIKINLKNKTNSSIEINRDTFRLDVGSDLLLPKLNFKEEFIDVGEIFVPFVLASGSKKDVVLVFELNDKQINNEYLLKVKNNNYLVDKKYIDVLVNTKLLESGKKDKIYNIGNEIDFNGNVLENIKVKVNGYDINKSFNEKYTNCNNEVCNEYDYIIKASNSSDYVLRIDSNISGNDNSLLNMPTDFYKYFVFVNYRSLGNLYNIECKVIDTKINSNYTYIEVPSNIIDSSKLELVINNRENKYTLVLK